MVKNLLFIFILTAVVACGGTTSTTEGTSTGKVAVVVTDDLTADYSEVWITLYEVSAYSETNEVTLFESYTGEVINLAELNGVGDLLAVMDIPSDTYTSFEIKLSKEITLVTPTGETDVRTLVPNRGTEYAEFEISGELVITDGVVTTFAVDFDLSKFKINGDGNVVPVIAQIKHIEMDKEMKQTRAESEGEILALTDTGFVLMSEHGTEITVILNDAAIITYEDGLSLDLLEVGMYVEVHGSFDVDTMTIEAMKVELETPDSEGDDGVTELEGSVVSITDSVVSVNIKHAEYIPETDTIDVTITETTHFSRGKFDDLAEGVEIEVEGIMELDGTLTAISIEVEGAGHKEKADHTYSEIHGTVVSLVDSSLTVLVVEADGIDLMPESEETFDIAKAYIENGTVDDLVEGTKVEIKGTVDDMGILSIVMVEIDLAEMPADTTEEMPPMETPVI